MYGEYDCIINKPPIEEVLAHAGVKGMEWKNHKYIRKANGSYYYPEGSSGAKYSEYTKGDPDFDESNYSEKNRLGDSDFYGFTNKNGDFVVIEEDMKWTLPKGTKVTPDMIQRLSNFNSDGKLKGDDWVRGATEAITGKKNDGKLSERDIDNLSNEVIRGNFKNGKERKELLGEYFQQVQDRVNQKMKASKKKK